MLSFFISINADHYSYKGDEKRMFQIIGTSFFDYFLARTNFSNGR